MQQYIKQLIEDLQAAHKLSPIAKQKEPETQKEIIAELEEIDRLLTEEPEKPMHNIFGIDPIMFPPIEKLQKKQAHQLVDEILELWAAFNIEAVYPKKFPKEQLYPLFVKKFKEPFIFFPMGITGIEFCDYESENCPFGEYCTCKDFIDD